MEKTQAAEKIKLCGMLTKEKKCEYYNNFSKNAGAGAGFATKQPESGGKRVPRVWRHNFIVIATEQLPATVLPAYCDIGYCDKTLIVTVLSSKMISSTLGNYRIL